MFMDRLVFSQEVTGSLYILFPNVQLLVIRVGFVVLHRIWTNSKEMNVRL